MKTFFLSILFLLLCVVNPLCFASPRGAAQVANLLEDAGSHYKDANYSTAIDLYKKALERDINNPSIRFGLGASYIATENYSAAVDQLLRAIELNPALTEAYFSLSYAYQALGKKKEAFEVYRQGLGFDLNKKLPRSIYWNEVVIGSNNSDDDDIPISSLGVPGQGSNNVFKQDVVQKIATQNDESYYKNQIAEVKDELEQNPDDISLKYKLALLYLKVKDINKAQALQKEISGKNDEYEEDLIERIDKLQKKLQASKQAPIEAIAEPLPVVEKPSSQTTDAKVKSKSIFKRR